MTERSEARHSSPAFHPTFHAFRHISLVRWLIGCARALFPAEGSGIPYKALEGTTA